MQTRVGRLLEQYRFAEFEHNGERPDDVRSEAVMSLSHTWQTEQRLSEKHPESQRLTEGIWLMDRRAKAALPEDVYTKIISSYVRT